MSQIKKVLIVGGGSAGWMTAAILAKKCKFLDISLIESKRIGTIGVGESTLGQINRYLDMLEIKDEDWMEFCNATYKTSIKFTDFRKKGTYFHYPFGDFDVQHSYNGIMDWLYYQAYTGNSLPVTDFAETYVSQVMMTDKNKMTRNEDDKVPGFNFHLNTAYHMDAEKFGIFLKERICLPNGVTRIEDTIVNIKQNEQGEISEIITEGGLSLTADLYIDCTGFKKLLIEKTMGSEFISFHDMLMNDRALAARVPYIDREKEMESVTNCTAIENGWVWNIPLWHRIGTGYVYSSKFVSQEQAEIEFKNHLRKRLGDKVEEVEFKSIEIRHGVQKTPWIKNVCAIGLALGFIEPLESTGLLTTHENLIRLVATLSRRDGYVNQFDIDGWNFAAREEMEGFKQFVSIHYALSERDDTEYWRHVTKNVRYAPSTFDLKPEYRFNNMELMRQLNIDNKFPSTTPDGKIFIAIGMGLNPVSKAIAEMEAYRHDHALHTWQEVRKTYESRKESINKHIDTLPTHYEFLRDNIYHAK
jgi:tryptophan halogenase